MNLKFHFNILGIKSFAFLFHMDFRNFCIFFKNALLSARANRKNDLLNLPNKLYDLTLIQCYQDKSEF